jgi:hypothetical protein
MSLIRHWLLYDNADPPRVTVIREPETAAQAQELGRYIEGPFVPEQPRGAVDDRAALLRMLKVAADALGDREPGVRNYLLNGHATYGAQ